MCSAYAEIQIYQMKSLTLLTAMAKVQFVNRKASFLFIDDVNADHEK